MFFFLFNSPYLSTLKPILRRMKTIKFSEEEISLLRNMYEDELAQAENYVDTIKDTLKKLGNPVKASKEVSMEMEPKVAKKRGRKPKEKTLEPKKKRGRPKKLVVPTIEAATVKVAKPAKKAKLKKRVAAKPKVKVVKKSIAKATPQKKSAEKVEVVPTSLPTAKAMKIKKVVKKKNPRRRFPQRGVRLAPLSKPLHKKEPMSDTPSQNESAIENPQPFELSNSSGDEVKE